MTTKVVPGMLIAVPDGIAVAREAASRLAKLILDALDAQGQASVALSGGGTPGPAYALLREDARIDWSKVDVFFVDERAVPPDSPRSNFRMVQEALLDHVSIPPDRIHRMRGEAADRGAAAREYASQIRARVRHAETGIPEFDVAVYGVGDDGHTASLFPGEPSVDVTDRLVIDVPSAAKREARLSITVPLIEHTRAALIVAVGKGKQEALERIWSTSGDVHHTPGRVLRGVRGSITWVIDKAAGGLG
ncbi:6-phosphogluconolactonase [Pendulispora albinea]|uniref:6-phosphogluconolactonase n=1 Tax=Pendulispora albinea TaxID=2741071 RepID=A0ABZ2MCD8_9BACT